MSLFMHTKDPILDAQKADISYHLKFPVHSCIAEYIGKTNRSLKERVSGHRNQTTSAIRNHHIFTKHPKAEPKDFTVIDSDSKTIHHLAKEALHICTKNPSLKKKHWQSQNPFSIQQTSQPSHTARTVT